MRYIKNIVPFTSELTFATKLAEITSMSLEHVLTVSDKEVSGNFIITGDYKTHAVSVNKEPFEFKLPFSVEITDNVDKDSIEFEILDFTYKITGENTIRVDIEFSVSAKELKREKESATTIDDLTDLMDIEPVEELSDLVIKEVESNKEEELTRIEETEQNEKDVNNEKNVTDIVDENTVISSINPNEDNHVTYHIHIVKDGENIETICALYNSNIDLISEYNDLSNVEVGSKLIIPEYEE